MALNLLGSVWSGNVSPASSVLPRRSVRFPATSLGEAILFSALRPGTDLDSFLRAPADHSVELRQAGVLAHRKPLLLFTFDGVLLLR